MTQPISIKPQEIEAKSFEMIENEFFHQTGRRVDDFPSDQFAVIRRVIHATGDFSFAHQMQFHPQAITNAIDALRAGKNICTDVNMAAAGINKTALGRWGGAVVCRIADPEIATQAAKQGTTRSEAAIIDALQGNTGIVAIGNAPTALLKIIEQHKTAVNNSWPNLVIGVPVGFVNAAESKAILAEQPFPFITALGRKGGSPVAAAIVNALMKLAAL